MYTYIDTQTHAPCVIDEKRLREVKKKKKQKIKSVLRMKRKIIKRSILVCNKKIINERETLLCI